MRTIRILIGSLILLVMTLPACSDDDEPQEGMPNPASVFCTDQGGTIDVREDAEGNQHGVCVFPDGSECDEWAFFRGECSPGATDESSPAPAPGMANPASEFCIDQGGRLEIRQEAGGEAGYCIGPNGAECPEWAFFNGECAWGDAGE